MAVPNINDPKWRKIFHVLLGESPIMPAVDARMALEMHPQEWKDRPWTEPEVEAYKSRFAKADELPVELKFDPMPDINEPPKPKRPRGRPFKKKEPQAVAAG